MNGEKILKCKKQKLTTKEQEKFNREIEKYLKTGEFCGELGDLMVMALTNVLKKI